MRTDVVSVEYGWWLPELPSAEPELGGVWRSNANLLTNADAQEYDNLLGQWACNGLPCRVYPAEGDGLRAQRREGGCRAMKQSKIAPHKNTLSCFSPRPRRPA